jgi:hypothetical protein
MKCLLCQTELTKSQIKEKNKFCSIKCANESKRHEEQSCLQCDKHVKKGSKFCSKSCSNIYNPRRKLLNTCKGCGVPCSLRTTYCSKDCYLKHRIIKKKDPNDLILAKDSVKNYIQRKKIKMIEYLGGKCMVCGYNKCVAALDFHHKDPKTKLFSLSGNSYSFEKCKSELDKCWLLCANCHRELHWKESNLD